MRVFVTPFAALLVLVALGPGVTTVLGDDNGSSVGTSGVAGAAAIPPVPPSVSGRTFMPAPPPAPAPTLAPALPPVPAPMLAPAPAFSPVPAEPVRDEVGNSGTIRTPSENTNIGVAGNGNVGVAVDQGGDQWRYRWHNNNWWYWTPANRWVYRDGNDWVNYEPAVAAAPAVGYTSQRAYYQSSPIGYYTRPYTTGYRGYYGSAYQGGYYGPAYQGGSYGPAYLGGSYGPTYRGGSYYGSGGYYGQPGISVGVGFGRGFRVRW